MSRSSLPAISILPRCLDLEAAENLYLYTCLAPFAAYLSQPDVTDIYVNRPGELWIETLGNDPVRFDAPELSSALLERLARQIAAISSQGISRRNPLLAASLPSGERVQIVMPPATRGHIAFAIRRHVVSGLTLEDYVADKSLDLSTLSRADGIKETSETLDIRDPVFVLRSAVRNRRNILISGGTSTGKTTFLNTLLQEIPSQERLIVIEDTPEVTLSHDNALGLIAVRGKLGEADVSVDDLLVASLRMRPDRIILGEIRGKEAVTFLRAVNTGHPGSISTIHADSPAGAVDQLALLVLQTGTRMAWDDVVSYINRSVHMIVQLERREGKRTISSIVAR